VAGNPSRVRKSRILIRGFMRWPVFSRVTHAAFLAADADPFVAFLAADADPFCRLNLLACMETGFWLCTCVFFFLFTSQIVLVIHMLAKKYT
jgi:hypothetical protein